ncbi:hypothetical protein FOL47_001713, partial [Perkinsus chesapeaki]
YDNGVIILAPPGQGTSWVFDNFKEGWPADHEDVIIQADYWHPYCNEMYRHELSMVFSAAEDDTKIDLLSLDFNDHALDAAVRLLTQGGEKLVVTKEVMNLFRVIDLAELKGHTILLLYRKLRFAIALRESLLAQNYSHPVMVLAKRIVEPLTADTPETHAMLHAVLWRLILWRLPDPRILAFHDLIMADSKRALIEVYERAWSHDGRLKQVVDFEAIASRTFESRKSIEWLRSKERRYSNVVSAEWEQFIGLALDRFREIDPATDDSIIRDHALDIEYRHYEEGDCFIQESREFGQCRFSSDIPCYVAVDKELPKAVVGFISVTFDQEFTSDEVAAINKNKPHPTKKRKLSYINDSESESES